MLLAGCGAEGRDEVVFVATPPSHEFLKRASEFASSGTQLGNPRAFIRCLPSLRSRITEAFDDRASLSEVESAARTLEKVEPLIEVQFHRRCRQAEAPSPSRLLQQLIYQPG